MHIRKLDFRRILIYAAILSLLIYFVLAWVDMIADHYERTGSDFIGFYSFGRISETRGIQHIYEIEAQQKLQEEIVGHPVTPIFYTHVPLTVPLSMLVVDENYVASFKRWAIILLFMNALNVYILVNMLEIQKFTKENLVILSIGAYLFDPTFSGFMNGQDTAIVLLGAALWASGFFSKKYLLAGIGLSLTTLRPQIALFLAIPFFFRHRRVFWGFVLGSSVLVAISVGMLGYEGTLKFIESLRYIESTVWHEAHALDMPTVSGIIRRSFTISNPEPVKNLVWIGYALGIVGFSFLWHKSPEINERHIGLLATVGIVLLPYAHYHDLILLLVPIFCILRIYQREDAIHQKYLAIAPLVVSWLFTLGFAGSGLFKFPIVYMVMLFLIYLLVTMGKSRWSVSSPAS
ncbi:MAG: DUF2029 domain-containing protein [Chloroflexi bacterium]|nr:MAG: DUF2029 domain-containing protein [Chloroflexota bacterium]